jgi:hypothetical protein
MSSNGTVSHDGDSVLRRASRSRAVRLVAGTMVAGLTIGAVATAGGGAAGAATTTYSTTASGRFLSGTIADKSLDSVAGLTGESAANKFGPTVTKKNDLNLELLNNALTIPVQGGIQLPGFNLLKLGALSQYASASPTGAALGASGAVDSNGAIGAGGTSGAPTGTASLDLSGLGGAALASLLNVKATVGAISARAKQAAGADGKQTGTYDIASLDLELDVPVLANVLPQLLTPVSGLLTTVDNTLTTVAQALNLGDVVLPSLTTALDSLDKISLPKTGAGAGAISIDLSTGTIKVSVEKLLAGLGLDLNNLPPNTSLVPYIIKALAGLPAALGDLAGDLVDTVNQVFSGITIGGIKIDTSVLTSLTGGLTGILSTLTDTLGKVVDTLTPITDLLSSLLDIVVNGQSTSKGIFTETAIELKVGGALSALNSTVDSILTTLDGLLGGSLPLTATNETKSQVAATVTKFKAAAAKMTKASATKAPASLHTAVLASARTALAATPLTGFHAAAAAVTDPLLQINLAQAAVGPSIPRVAPPASATPTPTTTVPTTGVPTGVPAGAGKTGGSPTLPLILVLLTIGLAAGGVTTVRLRGRRGMH